jgi:hypothetical protein
MMVPEFLGPYRILGKLGEGGPPSLNARFARSFGASAAARRGFDDDR